MSGHYPPLSCSEVKAILKKMGFAPRPQKGTSHEQWVKENPFHRVTVDCPKAPFDDDLIRYMCLQAGVTKKQFYSYR